MNQPSPSSWRLADHVAGLVVLRVQPHVPAVEVDRVLERVGERGQRRRTASRGAVGTTLSIFHSTRVGEAPSVTFAVSVCVPGGRVSAPRSRLRLLVGFGDRRAVERPRDRRGRGRRMVGLDVDDLVAGDRVGVRRREVMSASAARRRRRVSPTVHVRVCTKRGPLKPESAGLLVDGLRTQSMPSGRPGRGLGVTTVPAGRFSGSRSRLRLLPVAITGRSP